jgi:hypothetical protein
VALIGLVMHLVYRLAELADVDPCMEMMPPEFVCPSDLWARLPDVWRQWLSDGETHFTILEDVERPDLKRRVAFGVSVFVTDEFAAEAQTALPPSVAAQATLRSLEGRSPVLTRTAIGHANSGTGLNLLVLVIGWAADRLEDEEVRRVKARLMEAFLFMHGGYRLNLVMQEVYSIQEANRGVAIGARLITDYGRFYGDEGLPLPPPESRPYLLGIRREEVQEGSAMSPLFLFSPPRFAFRSGEQEMLFRALLGEADEDLARTLHVSPSTVHKRWQAAYERVAAVAPGLLPGAEASLNERSRGAEKRRHLLSYLRSHLEELRPIG